MWFSEMRWTEALYWIFEVHGHDDYMSHGQYAEDQHTVATVDDLGHVSSTGPWSKQREHLSASKLGHRVIMC